MYQFATDNFAIRVAAAPRASPIFAPLPPPCVVVQFPVRSACLWSLAVSHNPCSALWFPVSGALTTPTNRVQ